MRIGAVFPQTEIGTDPAAIRDYVQAVEGLGFDHLTAIDHVLGAGAPSGPPWAKFYTRDRMFHEPLLLFAHLAAVTERIELTTAILILSQRQTALVAKQAAELDVLDGGRTRLGIGIGWNAVEFEALNENFRDRGRRVEEQVEVLRRLWSEDLVTFEGRWHRLSDVGINPPPVQRPIPVWFGAFEAVAIRRAARLGDGWLMNPRTSPGDEGRAAIEEFHGFAREAGRDPAEIGIDATVHAHGEDPARWAEDARIWEDSGASHVTFRTIDCGFSGVDEHLDALRRFRAALGA